jgi:hypothetical protein
MPGIKISNSLKKRLPADQRDNLEEFLWAKSNSKCFLCAAPLNRASETIEADHEKPVSEGGLDTRENLNLAHLECNRFKRNSPSVDARRWLRFKHHLSTIPERPRYVDCLPFFKIEPSPVVIEVKETTVDFEFPDGTLATAPIFEESTDSNVFRFVFVEVPQDALYNDASVQPRAIKPGHVLDILTDIQKNPIYEVPGCRLKKGQKPQEKEILMFDGQHKTLAAWLAGRKRIVVKLFLNLSRDQAVQLVNSVQAKIKKLPLSPFELITKLADEWKSSIEKYLSEVGEDKASEDHFIKWLDPTDRSRAKSAMEAARYAIILEDDELAIMKYIQRAGQVMPESPFLIKENMLKSKVLKQLIYSQQLDVSWVEGARLREHESINIVRVLNMLVKHIIPMHSEGDFSPQERIRAERLSTQAALSYTAELLKAVVSHEFILGNNESAFMKADPDNSEKWDKIEKAIERLISHPVWTATSDAGPRMRAVEDALSKNQNIRNAFESVRLDTGYLITGSLPGELFQ